MKWILLITAFFWFTSCSAPNADSEKDAHAKEGTVAGEGTSKGQLVLNNGAKWETDEPTRLHARNLMAMSDSFQLRSAPSSSDYLSYARAVDAEVGLLITDCKMKGQAHDALHLWLGSVIEDVKQLRQVAESKDASEVASRLGKDIQKFNQFFN